MADMRVEILSAEEGEDYYPNEFRLCGSVENQTNTVNSDIDIIVADIPGNFTQQRLGRVDGIG
jgi:predicted nucleotidyltransferase